MSGLPHRCRTSLLPILLLLGAVIAAQSASAQAPSVERDPARRIAGESAGALRFSGIAAVRVGANGRVAVLDPLDRRLVLFEGDGKQSGVIEGTGRGPRELSIMADVCGDPARELLVLDPTGPKVGVVDSSWRIVAERVLGATSPIAIACSQRGAGGVLVSIASGAPVSADNGERMPDGVRRVALSATLQLWRSGNQPPSSVAIPQYAEMLAIGGGGMPRPLGSTTTVRVSDGGEVVVVRGDSAIVQVLTSAGAVQSSFALRPRGGRPRAADVEAANDDMLDRVPREVQPRLREMLSTVPAPRTAPTHRAAVVDDRSRLWVQRSLPSEPTTDLEVYALDGRLLSTVSLPAGLTLHDVNGAWLAMVGRDADGVAFVQLHRMSGAR